MSQRLSTSVTFQNLEDRVSLLENGQVLTPSKIISALGFTPANTAGDTFVYLNARAYIATIPGAGGSVNLSGSSLPGYTGIVEFRTAGGGRTGFIGFNAEDGPMHYGSDTGLGHYFEGGLISPDPAMHFGLRFNGADGILDFDSGDYLYYSRSSDEYLFMVGSSAQLVVSGGGAQVSNVFTVGDGNFRMSLNGGAPYVEFDSGDALLFNRGTDTYNLTLGNSTQLSVTASGTFVANILAVGDSNFGMSLNGGGQPISYFDSGDFLGYVRASNIFNFVIGGASKATIDGNGVVEATQFQADANCYFYVSGGTLPQFVFDSGDAIRFDRTANKFYFIVGNVAVASIDASGNLRIKGALSQGVTP